MTTIKYDISTNYFKCYNESQGIMINKNRVLKKKNGKVFGYLEHGLILLLYVFAISICSKIIWLIDSESIFSEIISFFIPLALILVIIYYVSFVIFYHHEKKKTHRGKLIFDEEGITDITEENIKVGLPWENILGVVTTKNTVTIITNKPVYFFVGIEEKENIIKAIEKYQENLLIIKK